MLGAALLWLGWSAAADTATVRGTAGPNVLRGTKHADTIYGRAGRDRIYGLQGNDTLYGGRGNDRIYGGPGNDRIYGGPGNDRIYGGPGNDTIWGGAGKDRISCGAGHDVVHADRLDRVASDCEVVIRPGKPKPKSAPKPRPTPPVTTTTQPPPATTAPTPPPPPPATTAPTTTTAPPPTTTTTEPPGSTCGEGPQSYRYSVVNQAMSTTSVSVTVKVNELPTNPAVGDHALAYVAVAYGTTANGCYAVGWLQGGIWRGATPFDPDSGSAFLYVESQTTAQGYRLQRLANVTVPSTHTFTLDQVSGDTWGIWVDGSFASSVELDQAPTAFSTAAEDYSVDGNVWPSFDWTFSGATPAFAHAPTGKLPYDSFTGTGWHTSQ